jgi:hypothetical protein
VQVYDVIYHEDLGVANMVQNHHLAKSIADAVWRVPGHPHFQSGERWEASASGPPSVHQPKVFRAKLWDDRAERSLGALAFLPGLWHEPVSGPQRCTQHPAVGSGRAVA